ncbi:PDZ domain-containing protein [Leucobacter sp. OH1287]|uniref:YlbL family protein n=1 Tax=Leucobacter sp. OH1287 TaxID=2491049 RepID=UPI000F5E3960|nr:S16 family serine protease [Leucobacter sp. OH1287]RRD61825.1 hypothetical protein EII30_00515 [Leucobacter sp. OH1287]
MTDPYTPTANSGQGDPQKAGRRHKRVVMILLYGLLAALPFLPSPYLVEQPGPVLNTLGEVETESGTEQILQFDESATVYPSAGTLNLLTVTISGNKEYPRSWGSLLFAAFDKSQHIVPVAEYYGEDESSADREKLNNALMESSQNSAAAAAQRELGMDVPTKIEVVNVNQEFGAAGLIHEGDFITEIAGEPILGIAQLQQLVQQSADKPLELTVERAETREVETVSVKPQLYDDRIWLIGVSGKNVYQAPVTVKYAIDRIGGPSAGMIFSLAIIDELTEGELTGGKIVSGTGTIDDTGRVGPIGGLTQKLYAASRADTDLFLMSAENCHDLPAEIPGDMDIAVVSTLHEAHEAVKNYAAGGSTPGIAACKTTP